MERNSKYRQAILACLRSTKVHPSAEWVYAQLHPTYPRLSLGTVYRNLDHLRSAGLIQSVGILDGQERYDGDTAPHAHALCTCCGKIDDYPLTASITAALQDAQSQTGFSLTDVRFMGLCPSCKKQTE